MIMMTCNIATYIQVGELGEHLSEGERGVVFGAGISSSCRVHVIAPVVAGLKNSGSNWRGGDLSEMFNCSICSWCLSFPSPGAPL